MKRFLGKYGLLLMAAILAVTVSLVASPVAAFEGNWWTLVAGTGLVGTVLVRENMIVVRTVPHAHSVATTTDKIYLINGIPSLAINSALAAAVNAFAVGGLIEYAKVSAQAWTALEPVYYDEGNDQFTNVYDASYVLAGVAGEAAANPTATGIVILIPSSYNLTTSTVTVEVTAGAVTYAAAEMIGGFISRDPAGASRADLSDTAALIVAAIPGVIVGSSFEFTIRNDADAAETITLTTNTGITLSGTMTIAQNNSKRFLAVVTNATAASEAVTIYSLGTVVH